MEILQTARQNISLRPITPQLHQAYNALWNAEAVLEENELMDEDYEDEEDHVYEAVAQAPDDAVAQDRAYFPRLRWL